jgi:1,4-dihydroxy-2-naphthoate octaprenyltransferase
MDQQPEKSSLKQLRLFVRLSRPHLLLGGILLYGLGASIARFLGHSIDGSTYAWGQAVVTLLQLMVHYLHEHYNETANLENPNRTLFSGGSGALGAEALPRRVALYAAIACLTLVATLVGIMLASGSIPLIAWLLLAIGFVGAFLYPLPPMRLASSGYGEVVSSVVLAFLVPCFAFSLQAGDLHRLLLMTTTPLIALHFAMMVALELPEYATDTKHGKRTLMVRLGWSTAMRLHDIAILLAIAGLAAAAWAGLPRRVSLGSLIALPLALAQVWQMWRIHNGFPPRWRVLTFGAAGLFALTAYLMLVGFLLS